MYLSGALLKISGTGLVRGIVKRLMRVLDELQSWNSATDRDLKWSPKH